MKTMVERYLELDEELSKLTKPEKKFVLKQLLEEHKENLDRIIQRTPDPDNAKDAYALRMMINHKRTIDEMIYVLIAELF